ncbi:hypothetical protein BH23PLA1_BH23PLA1_26580 [soil metagenome]
MPTTSAPASRSSIPIPSWRGGDLIFGEIGRDTSGSTSRAWRPSLGRGILLRRLAEVWADQPAFVGRLARHALAAEQIEHPHLAGCFGFGASGGRPGVAWEAPAGRRLSEAAEAVEPIDLREAIVVVLQVARGLRPAHVEGLSHGGLDLGRIWRADSTALVQVVGLGWIDPNRAGAVVENGAGEPSGPLPEADLAADNQALGRVLYFLVTGRAADIVSASVTAPDLINPKVSRPLSAAILRMIAPRPGEGFAGIDAVIETLERIIGAPRAGEFLPRAEAVEELEQAVQEYQEAPSARLKLRVFGGYFGAIAGLVLLLALLFPARLAGALLGLGVLTALAYFVVQGLTQGSPLFRRVVALGLGVGRKDALLMVVGLGLAVGTLVVAGVWKAWIAFGLASVILAVLAHWQIDRKLDRERLGPIQRVHRLLRGLRVYGLDEAAVRRFVRDHGGRQWAGMFEALFGYEALREARRERNRDRPADRPWSVPKIDDWRDPIARGIDARLKARREAQLWRQIQLVEERRLEASGMHLLTARRRSWRIAEAMLARLDDWRSAGKAGPSALDGGKRKLADALRQALEVPEEVLIEARPTPGPKRLQRLARDVAAVVFGARVRFLVGAVLLAGCLGWVHQNRLVSRGEIQDLAARSIAEQDPDAIRADLETRGRTLLADAEAAGPLSLPPLPRSWTASFRDFNPGVMGLILLASSFVWGWRIGLFVFPAALIALFGPTLGVPDLGAISDRALSLILAIGLSALGFVFGRE